MADLIHAGEIGDVSALIDDDGALVLCTPGDRIVLDRAELAALLARIKPVGDLVARSGTPISGMSLAIERSLERFGCSRVSGDAPRPAAPAVTEWTPECVRDVLLAAGFSARDRGRRVPGFNIGDGRARGEIIVEYLAGHFYKQPGDDDRRRSFEEDYAAALARAGFRVYAEMRYVIVTGMAATPC